MENFWPDKTCHPTLLICFNRPDKGAQVLSRIWKIPADLYLFRDGGGNPQDQQLYETLLHDITLMREIYGWKTHTRMENENLGGCHGPATAIRWFFESTPKGIVLEEDILPHELMIPTYSHALDQFESDMTIFALGAAPNKNVPTPTVETWNRNPLFLVWGWAGWADRILNAPIPNPEHQACYAHLSRLETLTARLYMKRELKHLEKYPASCWSYHLQTHVLQHGLDVLIPITKLTQNIGIEATARRTKNDFDDPPNNQECNHIGYEPAQIGTLTGNKLAKWKKSIELAKFRGITHEIRNRLKIGTHLRKLLHHES